MLNWFNKKENEKVSVELTLNEMLPLWLLLVEIMVKVDEVPYDEFKSILERWGKENGIPYSISYKIGNYFLDEVNKNVPSIIAFSDLLIDMGEKSMKRFESENNDK